MPFDNLPTDTPIALETPYLTDEEQHLVICFPVPKNNGFHVDLRLVIGTGSALGGTFKPLINIGIKNYNESKYFDSEYDIMLIAIEKDGWPMTAEHFSISPEVGMEYIPGQILTIGWGKMQDEVFIDWDALNGIGNTLLVDGKPLTAAILYYSDAIKATRATYYTEVGLVHDFLASHRPYVFSRYVKFALGIPRNHANYDNALMAVEQMHDLSSCSSGASFDFPSWFASLPSRFDLIDRANGKIETDIEVLGSSLLSKLDALSNLISSMDTDDVPKGTSTIIQRDVKKFFRLNNSVLSHNPEIVVTSKGLELPRVRPFTICENYAIASPSTNHRAAQSLPFELERGYPMVLLKNVSAVGEDAWVYYSGSGVPLFVQ